MNYILPSVKIVDIPSHGDERGELVSLESRHNIPFEVKRVYYIFNTSPECVRGKHAHKKLKQFLVCVSGSCTLKVQVNNQWKEFLLDSPKKGLLIEGLVWREMKDFSPQSVLLVLADEIYTEEDYIRSYEDFLMNSDNLSRSTNAF